MQSTIQNKSSSQTAIINLTALWAFSEGFLGGILNAVKIPFKGLLLGSIAVIIITLIAGLSDKKGIILRTGIIVMIVKVMLSPYTSVPAYFAVFVQTVLGELFFLNRNFKTIPAILLGIITSATSSIQRIIVLTLVFGNALWETIDQFTDYLYGEFFGGKAPADFKLSNWLIGIYVGIHCVVGFFVGLYASRLSIKIKSEKTEKEKFISYVKANSVNDKKLISKSKKKKNKFLKGTKIFLYIFLLAVLILSYVLKDSYFDSKSIWLMIIRSLLITILWFKLVSPLIRNVLKKRLMKNKTKYSDEIENIFGILPFIKLMFRFSRRESSEKNLSGIKNFFNSLTIFLSILINTDFSKLSLPEN